MLRVMLQLKNLGYDHYIESFLIYTVLDPLAVLFSKSLFTFSHYCQNYYF